MITSRITAALAGAIAALLAGCTTPAGPDPAAAAAIAYYQSIDRGTPENCDLTWAYRTQPVKLASCKANPVGGRQSIKSIEVLRTAAIPGPNGGPGKALTLTMVLNEGSAIYAVAVAQDDRGEWLWVKEESLPRPPESDADLIAALA